MRSPHETNTIIAAIDFTELSQSVILHAEKMAGLFNKTITLLHVPRHKIFQSDSSIELKEEEAKAKLDNLAEEILARTGLSAETAIRSGSIPEVLADAADEFLATLIVTGTHGVSGIEHIFGTTAMKIVEETIKTPVLVVQDKPSDQKGYPNILLPFTFTRESRQKLAWALYLSEKFNAKFHILAEEIKDEFLRKGVNNNIVFSKQLFEKHGIPYSIEYVKDTGNFATEINNYASLIKADMIVLMSEEETELSEIFTAPQEQEIITNQFKIPVLTLNPVDNMQVMRKAMFQ